MAAGLHDSDCALAAHIGLDYRIADKVKAAPNPEQGVYEYEHIGRLQLGMKISIGPNAQGPLYFIHARVGYDLPEIKEGTSVTNMAE